MVYNTFSRRNTAIPDVFQYENIPEQLRVQSFRIIEDILENQHSSVKERIFSSVERILSEEYGAFSLTAILDYEEFTFRQSNQYYQIIRHWILSHPDISRVLDAIELSFNEIFSELSLEASRVTAITTRLNSRFREHGVGYQFESGQIIRIDSQFMHSEAVRPVLSLLTDPVFQGANEEFLRAHEYYRDGDYQGCLVECLKSFESTMKIICDKRNWDYGTRPTASSLINVCAQNNLFPSYLRSYFSSGIPTVRNTMAGHGQGSHIVNVTQHIAELQLHSTATIILFLTKAEKVLP